MLPFSGSDEGQLYVAWLMALRSYQRLRRRIFRRFPKFLSKDASDYIGYLGPIRACTTLIAVGSCPQHFFRRFRRIINGKESFFSTPIPLLAHTVAALSIAAAFLPSIVAKGPIAVGKWHLVAFIILFTILMPGVSLILAAIAAMLDQRGSAEVYTRKMRHYSRAFEERNVLKPYYGSIFSILTYQSLDYSLAPWGYLYFTIYLIGTTVIYLIWAVACFLLAGFCAVTFPPLLLIMIPLAFLFLGFISTRLFTTPYVQLLKYLVPVYQDELLSLSFAQFMAIILKQSYRLNGFPTFAELSLQSWNKADKNALVSLSELWDGYRPQFLTEQEEARHKGVQIFARFRLARATESRLFGDWIANQGFSNIDLLCRAPQFQQDLDVMIRAKMLAVKVLSNDYRAALRTLDRDVVL
jgi:hypothetical protein